MDFKHLHKKVGDQFIRVQNIYKPLSIFDSAKKTMNAMTRLPTINPEHYFVDLLNTHDYVESIQKESPRLVDKETRTQGFKDLTTPRPINLRHRTMERVFIEMDNVLGLKGKRFKVATPTESVENLNLTSSSSFPDFKKKGKIKNYLIAQLEHLLNDTSSRIFEIMYVVVNWRIQPRRSGIKRRMYYSLPGIVQAAENMFVHPFIKHFDSNKLTVYAFANTYKYLKYRWHQWQNYKNILSLDINGFDLHINNYLLVVMFRYMKTHLKIDSKVQHIMFEKITDYNLGCVIASSVQGEPSLFKKKCGLMSGSQYTNLMGTFVNVFCILYYLIETGQYEGSPIAVCGDDCIIPTNYDISLHDITEFYINNLGMDISVEKSEIFKPGEPVYFLGYHFDDKARYFDEELVKKQLSVSENYIDKREMSTSFRLISKLASICFKCTYGFVFFDRYASRIARDFGIDMPKYFLNLFTSTGLNINERRDIADVKNDSWMDQ